MLPCKVALLTVQASDSHRTLPFEKPDHRRHRIFWGNSDAHMHMVRHQMTLDNLALLLPGQRVEDRTQLPAGLPENSPPWARKLRGTCSPISNGIGSGKVLPIESSSSLVIKPLEEDSTPGTVKPFQVSLVEPVAYHIQLSHASSRASS